MKTLKTFPAFIAVAVLLFLAMPLAAQDSSALSMTAASQPAPDLSYGASQIVQLAHAKVSDDTIVAYIRNSGNSYVLNADQIIYLRQQGVSDAVVNIMLNQPRNAPAAIPPVASNNSIPASNATVEPTVTYVQTVPSSSVYVIPDTQTYYYDSYYYHYPYSYPYYAYPPVTFSFGFGGHWGGGWRGGGGGWHGHR